MTTKEILAALDTLYNNLLENEAISTSLIEEPLDYSHGKATASHDAAIRVLELINRIKKETPCSTP